MVPVRTNGDKLINNLYGQDVILKDNLTTMLMKTSRTFKRDVIGYAKLKSPDPTGTLRESPLMHGDLSSGITM
jgi:hypothetical protein